MDTYTHTYDQDLSYRVVVLLLSKRGGFEAINVVLFLRLSQFEC